tara:strand:+ start:194 stop:628 length:435 start_codon:yes stop_codon:yes gene_type:complete
MATEWDYQLRLTLDEKSALKFRDDPTFPEFSMLNSLLARYDATLKCQFDAFSEYVETAERDGIEKYPLYHWTKDTIEDPQKKSKYLCSFTIYVLDQQIYSADVADPLEKALEALPEGEFDLKISKYNTDPANNPQMPEKYRTEA